MLCENNQTTKKQTNKQTPHHSFAIRAKRILLKTIKENKSKRRNIKALVLYRKTAPQFIKKIFPAKTFPGLHNNIGNILKGASCIASRSVRHDPHGDVQTNSCKSIYKRKNNRAHTTLTY